MQSSALSIVRFVFLSTGSESGACEQSGLSM